MRNSFKYIKNLVGDITPDQMRNVDSYVCELMSVFIPMAGPCYYSLIPEHTHPSYMCIVGFEETAMMIINGKIIDGKPGFINITSPHIPHHELLEGNHVPRYNALFIDEKYFNSQLKIYNEKLSIYEGINFNRPNELLPLLKQFIIESENQLPGYEQILRSITNQITHSIIRSILKISTHNNKRDGRMEIDQVIEYIYYNLSEKITTQKLANIANMSVNNFNREFRNEIAKSPNEFIKKLRLKKAKRLLLNNNLNMTDIAFQCGFGSSSHFSVTFKDAYKIAPSEYASAMKNGSIKKKDG